MDPVDPKVENPGTNTCNLCLQKLQVCESQVRKIVVTQHNFTLSVHVQCRFVPTLHTLYMHNLSLAAILMTDSLDLQCSCQVGLPFSSQVASTKILVAMMV